MKIQETKFNVCFHLREADKFNKLYLIFKYIYISTPFISIVFSMVFDSWMFVLAGGLFTLISWILSIKMKSLRNINNYAAKEFEDQYKKMFK